MAKGLQIWLHAGCIVISGSQNSGREPSTFDMGIKQHNTHVHCYEYYCIIMTSIKCYCIIMTGITYPVCHFISPSHDKSACVISLLLVCHFGYL